MWNIKDINQKKRYVTERLKNCKDLKEKEKLELSFITYLSLLDNSGTIRYTAFYNLMDRVTHEKFSIKKDQVNAKLEEKLLFGDSPLIDDNYLQFLLNICNNIAESPCLDFEEQSFSLLDTDYNSIVNMSYEFYKQLGNQEILNVVGKILNDESSINDSKIQRIGMENASGLTLNDYYFGKSYITIHRENSIFDYQVLNHEVMHGVDFYIKNKLPSENYYGFHEVPTYAIDYLFIDYLESKGIDQEEVQKLKNKKDSYLKNLARLTRTQIKSGLIKNKVYKEPTIDDIRNILNPQIIKRLLELESGVISYGLYCQTLIDKEQGISNIELFMKNVLSKYQIPDFSYIGLNNDTLLELSKQIGTYSMSNEMSIQETNGFSK